MGRFVFDLMPNQLNLHPSYSLPRKGGHASPPEAAGRVQRSNFQGSPRGALGKK